MHIEYLAAAPGHWTQPREPQGGGDGGGLRSCMTSAAPRGKPITSLHCTSAHIRQLLEHMPLAETDHDVGISRHLIHPENYMIPESTKNGVPLFYIPRLYQFGYEKLPLDSGLLYFKHGELSAALQQCQGPSAWQLTDSLLPPWPLSCYFAPALWWAAQSQGAVVAMQAVAHILSMLDKKQVSAAHLLFWLQKLQQIEAAQLQQREANLTALAAIGPRRKRPLEQTESQVSLLSRLGVHRVTRVMLRDLLVCMEQDRFLRHSLTLYKAML
ncbi:transcription initiation factor TFIID subunit 4-like protein [Lates japonicus]|uniref:Transcription initiation factor TFIID subunit 4-like protein n=1 Tax=Lates japonicus TaxID=270547 RepID=A0AAD3N3T1_LATJO|nr:transcription initiation factor TFIID subunit 4-like protein [Lates japonicus]